LLGVFLLGMLTERAGKTSALVVGAVFCLSCVAHVGVIFLFLYMQAMVIGPTFMLYYGIAQFLCPNGAIGGSSANATALPGVCTETHIFTWSVVRASSAFEELLVMSHGSDCDCVGISCV